MNKTLAIRATALILCILSLLSLAACGVQPTEDLPDGMQNATAEGAKFRLYIPTSWNINTSYGVSGGYYTFSNTSTVSVVEYPITDDMEASMQASNRVDPQKSHTRMDWFYETSLCPPVEEASTGGVKTLADPSGDTLGRVNARRYQYAATVRGKKLCFLQVVAERDNSFYVFTFTGTDGENGTYALCYDTADKSTSDVSRILKEFKFAAPYEPTQSVKRIDDSLKAPAGMKAASAPDVSYCFYVPTDWKIDLGERIASAKSRDGRAVVSVTTFMPTLTVGSVVTYFEETEKMLQDVGGADYERLSEKDIKLGGGPAKVYEYRYTVGGTELHYRQIVGNYRGLIYTLTYAAKAADYETHLGDFDAIVKAFSYR